MYKVYKDEELILEIENIAQVGDAWSFGNGTGENIEQKLVTTNIEQYIIKDIDGNIIVFANKATEEQQRLTDLEVTMAEILGGGL